MSVLKKSVKVVVKMLKVLGLILLALVVALTALYLYADNCPVIFKGYQEKIETGGALEAKYLQFGEYAVRKMTARAEKPINRYTITYPEELETSDRTYPMILMVNGTGFKATKYEPQFELFASWGFVVVGNQDKGTGSGQTTITTLNYMLAQNEDPDSVFYHRIDTDSIGITGFSQGGSAVFNALSKYEDGKRFKTAVPLSPASEAAAAFAGYPYDSSLVHCPILIFAGTEGTFETETVIPIEKLTEQFDRIDAPKVMARRVGMDHDHMMYSAGGYVLAWFRWQLMGDEEAARVFIGDTPELLGNPLYQDQRINLDEGD